jgi:hypothetical protein
MPEKNRHGFQVKNLCRSCGEDFAGVTLFDKHRVAGNGERRCLDDGEMEAKGWHQDIWGRWRAARHPEAPGRKR